jgi:hypothetical protein
LCQKFPISYIILLKRFYDIHKAQIKSYSIFPYILHIINGVKQRGILSPFLYNYFINDLFEIIEQLKIGINFHDKINIGIVGFADDSFLLSTYPCNLQIMVNTCSDYGKAHNIKLNKKNYFDYF